MATKYARLRIGWGTIDLTAWSADTPSYSSTQMKTAGTSAVAGTGTAIRRCTVEIDRADHNALLDPAYFHFDFMNFTSGDPDDTWTDTDFTNVEGYVTTFWNAVRVYSPPKHKLTRFIWHRVGKGVGKPNPAVRTFSLSSPITGGLTAPWPEPQQACSITFRNGVRRSWGRTYIPFFAQLADADFPYISTSQVNVIANAADALMASASTNDYVPVVYSAKHESALAIEAVEVDNVADVIRRRRAKRSTYKNVKAV